MGVRRTLMDHGKGFFFPSGPNLHNIPHNVPPVLKPGTVSEKWVCFAIRHRKLSRQAKQYNLKHS